MSKSVGSLAGKIMFITGGSRGIGRSIALRAAADGAKIILAAKTVQPHAKLPGTIIDVAEEVVQAGGQALPLQLDVRFEDQVNSAIEKAAKHFGGIDILVNNASAITLSDILNTSMKNYDLMMDINVRGSFLCSKAAIPYLQKGNNPHILYLSPPMAMQPKWLENHLAYTISKYSMSMSVMGLSAHLKKHGIAVNALWPKIVIFTSATKMLFSDAFSPRCRRPEIMSDAAHAILTLPSDKPENTGNFFLDETALQAKGVTDMETYSCKPGGNLAIDLFLDEKLVTSAAPPPKSVAPKQSKGADSVDTIFSDLQRMLTPEIIAAVKSTFSFDLSGSEPGLWFIDLKSPAGGLGKLASKEEMLKMDAQFHLDSEDFVRLFQGSASTTDLFSCGKMTIEGDLTGALRLDKQLRRILAKK